MKIDQKVSDLLRQKIAAEVLAENLAEIAADPDWPNENLESFIDSVNAIPSWSYRIEGGHQATQITVFNGAKHHCAIAQKDESVVMLFDRVMTMAIRDRVCDVREST
jgi:hypothetical protein